MNLLTRPEARLDETHRPARNAPRLFAESRRLPYNPMHEQR
jgi:hypothetical protein